MDIKRIKIMFYINRPHLTFDILSVLKRHDVAVLSMEVYSNVIYLKLPFLSKGKLKEIESDWEKVYGYDHMEEIDVMSFEEKDVELKNVLNLIGEGVLMLSSKGLVEYGNKVSYEIIEDISVGETIFEYIDDEDLKKYITSRGKYSGGSIENKPVQIKKQSYLLSVNNLYSENGIFCGFLLILNPNDVLFHDSVITFEDIMGEDKDFKQVIEIAKLYAYADAAILLTGESGTGKEMFARAIHSESNRSNKPFVGINCAAIPDELLESELFGYAPGSFTGASKNGKIGIFELAKGGTVFLDEIGEMNYHLQAKLLRVLQEKKIRPIGSQEEKDLDVRIISATNRNLEKLIEEGSFRMDLFYRLNIFRIKIPSLRQRKDDIPNLTEYFLNIMSTRYNIKNINLDKKAKEKLMSYDWPGNIRELQNVIERAVVLSQNGQITSEHITFDKTFGYDNIAIDENNLNLTVANFEREVIVNSLRRNKTIRATAKKLGVSHTLIINRIKKYKIDESEWMQV